MGLTVLHYIFIYPAKLESSAADGLVLSCGCESKCQLYFWHINRAVITTAPTLYSTIPACCQYAELGSIINQWIDLSSNRALVDQSTATWNYESHQSIGVCANIGCGNLLAW